MPSRISLSLDTRRSAGALSLGLLCLLARSVVAQAPSHSAACVPHGQVSRRMELPPRPVYATLETRDEIPRTARIFLATLLQEVALAFVPPDSTAPLPTYSFALRLQKDGRLTDAQVGEGHIPESLADATIRAIDSVSRAGGIGPVVFDMPQDPLPLQMVFRLGGQPSETSVPFYSLKFPAFLEYETDRPALSIPGNRAPRYPEVLRQQNIEGEVLVQFVVDTMGQPDMRTLRLLGPSRVYREFVKAVLDALPSMRFTPAEYRGCKVKQLVQLPFAFKLNR